MTDDTPAPNDLNLTGWFPEPLSDEAAYSIHLFLQQFTCQFENTHYSQISRYVEEQRAAARTKCHSGTPWDDRFDF